MDFPKSVSNVGLVDGKFVDESIATGQVGSLIPSAWGNAVTAELLNILAAAGIAPDESAEDQVLTALRGSGLFQTAAQLDSSKRAATTEFVQRAIGSYAGQTNYAVNTELSAVDVGKLSIFTAAGLTATLPAWDSVPPGGLVSIVSTAGVTVKSRTGETLGSQSGATGPFTLVAGTRGVFRRLLLGGGWSFDGGDAALKYSPMFTASMVSNGYQKLPSGLIIQWGSISAVNGANTTATYPITFPAACFQAFANAKDTFGGTYRVSAHSWGLTSMLIANTYTGAIVTSWFAIGY
jgi:hypothetical protein